MNDTNTTGTWAYVSLLVGGLLIILGGVASALMMGAFGGMMGWGMMSGYTSYVTASWLAGMAYWMAIVGLVAGGIVLYAAYRLRKSPAEGATAGTLAIVGGVLSLLSMGGWLIGAVFALVGGALAIAGQPTRAARPPTH